jgi:hypothetical protein
MKLQGPLLKTAPVVLEMQMFNWPDEDWADGFLAGAATVSLIGIAGAAFVLLVHTI